MIEFNKSLLSSSPLKGQFGWFSNKLSNDFTFTIGDKNLVIFGYNGIGKTTIYKAIKSIENVNFEYLAYTDEDSFIHNSSKKLIISIDIVRRNQLRDNIEKNEENLTVYSYLKNNKIALGSVNSALGVNIKRASKISGFLDLKKLTWDDVTPLLDQYNKINPAILISNWKKLQGIASLDNEIKKFKDNKLVNILYSVDNIITDETTKCPVCGSTKLNLKEIVKNEIQSLQKNQNKIITDMYNSGDITEDNLKLYFDAFNAFNSKKEAFKALLITGGNKKEFENINALVSEMEKDKAELANLNLIAKEMYQNVCKEEKSIKKDFCRYLKIEPSAISFDDKDYIITINLNRDIETYSTGETNMITFLYKVYSFLGSDKEVVILDDPISSLDMINCYKMAYELVRLKRSNKKIVVLTHSTNFLNIINCQNNNIFSYLYIDEINGKLIISSFKKKKSNVIDLRNISGDEFITALIDRDIELINGSTLSTLAEAFHYTLSEKRISPNITNYNLISMIDNFSSFTHLDFDNDMITKIKYLAALRIWIEKNIYDLISIEDDKSIFLSKNSIYDKINYVLPMDGSSKLTSSIRREDILSKKVMLNQAIHFYSLVEPMAYAMNMSFDQLAMEIKEIKALFP